MISMQNQLSWPRNSFLTITFNTSIAINYLVILYQPKASNFGPMEIVVADRIIEVQESHEHFRNVNLLGCDVLYNAEFCIDYMNKKIDLNFHPLTKYTYKN